MRNPAFRRSGRPGDARRLVAHAAALTVGLLALTAAPAYAEDVAGPYDVKFEQVSTNCEHPVALPQTGSLKIEIKGGDLQVDIDHTPLMIGKPAKNGRFTAKSRPAHTSIAGMDGVFSIAGRISPEGLLQLTMVGEYQTQGRPLCTQTWNLSGIRAQGDRPKK